VGDDGDDRSLGAFLDRNIQGSIENHGGLLFQIVDATIVAAPKQRNTQEEKQALRDGRIPEEWKDKPAKLAQKEDVLDRDNTASEVWADTAYRSVKNEAMLARRGFNMCLRIRRVCSI
jgi:hypothetical protein